MFPYFKKGVVFFVKARQSLWSQQKCQLVETRLLIEQDGKHLTFVLASSRVQLYMYTRPTNEHVLTTFVSLIALWWAYYDILRFALRLFREFALLRFADWI